MTGAITIVFLTGVILLLLGKIRRSDAKEQKKKEAILNDEQDADKTIVYKYLPRDLDTFYRTQETPSKLYSSSVF